MQVLSLDGKRNALSGRQTNLLNVRLYIINPTLMFHWLLQPPLRCHIRFLASQLIHESCLLFIIGNSACRKFTYNFPSSVISGFNTTNRKLYFTGTKSGSQECVLQMEDPSEKHFMRIEAKALASSYKSCSPQRHSPNNEGELHIINIPEGAGIR